MVLPGLTGVGLMALEFCTVKLVSTIILGDEGPLLGKTSIEADSILCVCELSLRLVRIYRNLLGASTK